MHSYWFWIGSFPVRSYSTIFAAAFLLGFGVTLYFAKTRGKPGDAEHWWNLAPLCLLGGIVGARVWQVFFFDWPYYRAHPGQIPLIWHGGLSIQGGIVGACAIGYWYLRRHKLSFWRFADLGAPGILLGQSIGRDADFMNGSAYGAPTHQGFGIVFPPGTLAHAQYGSHPLWPAVIWEGQADVILFAVLLILMQRKKGWPPGFAIAYYLVAYDTLRFFIEMLRGDSPRFALGWDAAQYTALPMIAIGIVIWIYGFRKKRRVLLDGSEVEDFTKNSDEDSTEQ
ncbi:MAG: prolipoprotein diacylglyceryl transferase [Alicyclobacillaceae bacterium]|uniref:prolipoprotein diacylglyceryl transferase n=1 Tax=Alicyclobacillus sp. SP_1 TaxID=2942475 RepID=UPI00215704CA|nr:prolipoprotein diacylglyceryl transferase [Alicyclobacillus sp. SP_1]MCY0888367.1 prolipoprotein diacylglyceryl transferase [Alicyclobacillaceae bacterium]MCY0895727.1 prolipoprotein diacylglyceryl transferase [Alicyclobacillaceae bacterium]